ncbi:proton-coupled amino acid transporter-like protein CG1139 [Photinus pyralis]|nr:proton-coupled amino acid transporter-like protein CG1139 [Photinus pyralis]XP_031340854.1 proton-coupled amino acid transporter-like protein CG1139 [Photinus pyralis]
MRKNKDIDLNLDDFTSTTIFATKEVRIPNDNDESIDSNEDYNPFEHRVIEHPTSTMGSLIHILKGSLGTGILAMPYAFKHAGLVLGSIATIVIGILCTHCIHLLVSVSHELCRKLKVPSLSLAETCEAAFDNGPKRLVKYSGLVKTLADIFLVITHSMGVCVYIVFIAESTQQLVKHWYPEFEMDTRIYSVITMIPLLLSMQIRQLKYLVPFSLIANVCLVIGFGITLYYIFEETPDVSKVSLFESLERFPTFLSTIIFAMEGVGVIMPVENTMRQPQRLVDWFGVLNVAMGIVVVLYSITGFFGFIRYGSETEASITLNLPVSEGLAQSVKVLVVLAVFFTYNLQAYVALDVIWRRILSPRVQGSLKVNVTQIILRCLFVAITVLIAVAVRHLDAIITLFGAVCLSTLGILLPAVIDTVLHYKELGFLKWRLFKNIFLCVFSLTALISGSATGIRSLLA